jgi:bacterioferritin
MFTQQILAENIFLKDISVLRESAKIFLSDASHDATAGQDNDASIKLLQTVLAAEIVCIWRYTMMSVSQDGLQNNWIGTEFQEQANDEREHMRLAASRIEQLGGTPNFSPDGLVSRSAACNDGHGNFTKRISENLVAEQSIIEHYRDLIGYFSSRDPETCAMLEDIIRDEEHHSTDMQDILGSYLLG